MLKLIVSLLLAFATLFSSAFAEELSWNFTFSPFDIVLTSTGEYTVVSFTDASNPRDVVGAPAIPAKYANILLPDGATDVSVTATGSLIPLASDVTPWPVQNVAPKSKAQPPFVAPDPAAYASASPWPAAVATFEGLHEMQGSTFVSVRVNPIVYIGSEKTLYYRPSVTVNVSYTAPAAPRANRASRNTRISDMVNALVVNPKSSSDAPRSNKSDEGTVDYLIITSSSLSSAFQNLANYRASAIGGDYKTLVVTKESISSSYTGDDIQMKIRNCIKDYVNNHGTTYVVLGGDDTIVPDRDTYAKVDETVESHMPTDLYYSDLTGTWKSGSTYGATDANVDMFPDVIVGRIPVRTADQLNGYLAKVRAFEADLTYTRNSIILGGPAAWCRYYDNKRPSDNVTGDGHIGFRDTKHGYVSDSEMWLRRLYRDGIKSYWDNAESATDRTINLACDAITSWDSTTGTSGNKVLSASNLKNWLNNGYTHLMFSGHGYPQGWGMESSTDYSTTQAAAQTNLVAFVYTDACLTGAFDQDGYNGTGTITIDYGTSDQETMTSEPCLGEAFLRNANGGALVHMGCARYGWGTPDTNGSWSDQDSDGYYTSYTASNTSDGGPSTVYAYKFYKRLYEAAAIAENRTIGKAFAMSKADMISQCSTYDCERWIQFGLNYLGDPAIVLYPRTIVATPKDMTISDVTSTSFNASWTAVENAESYQVDVVKGTSFETSLGELVYQCDFSSTTGWTLSGTGTYAGATYCGNGVPSIKFDGTGDSATSPDFGSGAKLQFWAYGNLGAGSTFKISGLVNGTWTDIETVSIDKGGKTYELNLPAGTSKVKFYFTKNGYNCALDDVVIYGPSEDNYVDGWHNTTVTGTSANITGLVPNTEYSVRVRAVRGEDTSKWSDIATVTTTTLPPTLAVNDADVTATSASLSWTVFDDVTSYTLQLASDDLFTEPTPDEPVTLIENSATAPTEAPDDWTYNYATNYADRAYLVLFKDNYVITEAFDASGFDILTLSLDIRILNGTANPSVSVSYSTDDGNTWSESLGILSAINATMINRTLDIPVEAGLASIRLRIESTSTVAGRGVAIQNIVITGTKMIGGSILSTTSVNGTSYTFSNLKPCTTYFARVKGEAEWSNIVSFTTNIGTLILASGANNYDAIIAANGGKYNVTLADRTLYQDGAWNTLCLPFDVTIAGSPLAGADVRAMSSASLEDGTLTLNFTDEGAVTAIEAGTPYIIKWTSGSDIVNPVFEGVTVSAANNDFTSIDQQVRFVGTYDLISFDAENKSILFMGGDNKVYYPLNGAKIGAFRSYFQRADGSPVKQFVLNFGGEDDATGIFEFSEDAEHADVWFDLNGRRLSGKPSLKGIYIHDGKKTVK